jgi:phosphatidylserine/phosphatidylglycerophosphate/cardiolipin synthase-like enzyme
MPSVVMPITAAEALAARPGDAAAPAVFVPEIVPRNCRLDGYVPVAVPKFKISSEVIAYASPDSTFAVTKKLFDGARKSILIGIYDFSADHVKQLVLQAMQRGVKVQLMLDIDGAREQEMFDELEQLGADCTPAPSCASKRAQFFSSSHEKVIVIDDEWSLVQSGNYSDNSIPLNVKDGGDRNNFVSGNRDMGLAVKSKPLAKFFRKILEADIKLELNGAQALGMPQVARDTFLVEAAPTRLPKTLFASKRLNLPSAITVQPVLSPDNYMKTVPGLLRAARKSIFIEQQYIRAAQTDIAVLLQAIADARQDNPGLDVRIVLGKIFHKSDLPDEEKNLKLLKDKFGLLLGTNIRYVDTTRFVHCHNKMILIDGKGVLISSQNWSNSAVTKNREAGLSFEHKGIRDYFARIFEDDWATAKSSPTGAQPEVLSPQAVRTGRFVRVVAADYAEV